MFVLRSAGAALRSSGKPTSVVFAALRSVPWAQLPPDPRLLPTATAVAHASSKAAYTTHAGRAGLRLPVRHGSGAAASLQGTVLLRLQASPTQDFSTAPRADAADKRAEGGAGAAAAVPLIIWVKVDDKGKFVDWPIEWESLQGLRLGGLLEALASSKVFGLKFKDVDLSGCIVSVCKLPAGTDEPTAADEADAGKFVELKGAKTVGITAGSITKDDQICIRVQLPAEPAASKSITYRLLNRTKLSAPTTKTFKSAADFDKLISGRSLLHMRKAAAKSQPDVEIAIITDLDEALAAANVPDTYFALQDTGSLWRAEVTNLLGFRDNAATAFEMESTKALARDEQLLHTYGKLQLLNEGRSVTFFDVSTNQPYLELDGVVVNTTVALINEAKSSLQKQHVDNLKDVKLEKLEQIIAKPHLYRSEPADVIDKLHGLNCVPVASGKIHSVDAKTACADKGVHLLESDGSGYRCMLHIAPSVGATAGSTSASAAPAGAAL